jgi:two-component system sensor histidine kinase BaeS
MFKSLWVKFLLLLLGVAAVALSGTFALRGLMLRDFRDYLEGEAEDKIYLIQADLEGAYERQGGWQGDFQEREAIRALMSGFEMKLTDQEGKLVIDTDRAIAAASQLVKKRLEALAQFRAGENPEQFVPYPLFLAGSRIGTLAVRELRPVRENLFLGRSDRFMALSILIVGGVAVLLSILFSRRLTRPVKELALAASAISRGELQRRVAFTGSDELGTLAESFNHMAKVLETQEMLRRKLIADVAHELRTPLAVMRGEIEGMLDGLLPTDPARLQSLHEETGRLKNMVNAIEELNKAEASRLSLQKQWIEVKSFLEGIAERYRISFQEKGIALELVCDGDYRLYVDPERLSQIILNLLSNALRATGTGGTVTMRVALTGGGLTMTVEDTGSGIREEDLPYIFERFYRGAGGGLGIGLTIVKELADAHGASLEVQSTPGKGTSFAVHFPGEAVHNVS